MNVVITNLSHLTCGHLCTTEMRLKWPVQDLLPSAHGQMPLGDNSGNPEKGQGKAQSRSHCMQYTFLKIDIFIRELFPNSCMAFSC